MDPPISNRSPLRVAPWRVEHGLARDALEARLARALSLRQYSSMLRFSDPIEPVWYGEGWDCDVFRIVDANGASWLCKLPKRAEVVPWIHTEADILEELAASDLSIAPRLGLRGRSGELPYPWIAVSPAPGAPVLDHLDDVDARRFGSSYGECLAKLHSLEPRCIGPRPPRASHRVDELVQGATQSIATLRHHVDAPMLGQIEALVVRLSRHAPEPVPAAFVHGDTYPEHVFVDLETNRLVCLIDWADTGWGDICDDLAVPAWCLGDDFLENALAAYGAAEDEASLRRRIYRLGAAVGIEGVGMAEEGSPNADLTTRIEVLRARAHEGWLDRVE